MNLELLGLVYSFVKRTQNKRSKNENTRRHGLARARQEGEDIYLVLCTDNAGSSMYLLLRSSSTLCGMAGPMSTHVDMHVV